MLTDYAESASVKAIITVYLTLTASSSAWSQSPFRATTNERLAYKLWLFLSASIRRVNSFSAIGKSPSMHALRTIVFIVMICIEARSHRIDFYRKSRRTYFARRVLQRIILGQNETATILEGMRTNLQCLFLGSIRKQSFTFSPLRHLPVITSAEDVFVIHGEGDTKGWLRMREYGDVLSI